METRQKDEMQSGLKTKLLQVQTFANFTQNVPTLLTFVKQFKTN